MMDFFYFVRWLLLIVFFFFSSRRRHTRWNCDWSSDVCSSDLACLAANLSGPRRHRYGAPRDLVIGVTVVLADGTVASSGGKVVKNVAGYDLGKLFCGSRGALGWIQRAALRLHPHPAAESTLVVPFETPEEGARLAQSVLRSQLVPSALDILVLR